MKKKIDWLTVVTSDSGGGGAEQTQLNLITELIDRKENCVVIILKKTKKSAWKYLDTSCEIIYLPTNILILNYLYLLPYLFFFLRKRSITYTFSSQTLINALLGICKRLQILKSTLIVRESNSIFELLSGLKLMKYKLAYKIGYKYTDLIICQTSYMRNQLLRELPWLEKKTNVIAISNPINHKTILKKSNEEIDGLSKENYIVAAGRLTNVKGFDILIDSYGEIYDQLNGAKLFILGEGPDREKLTQQIKNKGLEDKIILKGLVPNVYPYFKNAKLCVMSSRIEGFPNVLLQMMSQNDKVVTTLSAGDIDKIKGIFTCQINDRKKLSDTIISCFKTNTTDRRSLFNEELSKRNLKSFIDKILKEI